MNRKGYKQQFQQIFSFNRDRPWYGRLIYEVKLIEEYQPKQAYWLKLFEEYGDFLAIAGYDPAK